MKFFLIVTKGKRKGLPIPVDIDLFVLGSAKECQLRADHPKIGEQHCGLIIRQRKVFICDFNSGHPTIVNGEVLPPSAEWPLHMGDRIEVGPFEFMIQFNEKKLSQRDLEEWALGCMDAAPERRKTHYDEIDDAVNQKFHINDASDAADAILRKLSAQRGIVKGRLRISHDHGVTVMRLNDVYLVDEAELALLNKELHDNIDHPNMRILIDFKNVRRMSSHAGEMFAGLVTWMRHRNCTLAFCRLQPELQTMIGYLPGLERVCIFADKTAAMAATW